MLQVLGFKLNPITLVYWADWFSLQWDQFADTYDFYKFSALVIDGMDPSVSFRTQREDSYHRYRALMHFVDAINLDFSQYQYTPRELIAAVMYLVIGGP